MGSRNKGASAETSVWEAVKSGKGGGGGGMEWLWGIPTSDHTNVSLEAATRKGRTLPTAVFYWPYLAAIMFGHSHTHNNRTGNTSWRRKYLQVPNPHDVSNCVRIRQIQSKLCANTLNLRAQHKHSKTAGLGKVLRFWKEPRTPKNWCLSRGSLMFWLFLSQCTQLPNYSKNPAPLKRQS